MFRKRIAADPTTDLSGAFLASALGHVRNIEEARRIWGELRETNPRYCHVDHLARLPFNNPGDAEKILEGLRKAGLAQ